MPTYDYACPHCGGFDALRPLARRDEPAACPACGAASPRVWAAPARLARLDGAARRAMETNERSANQPRTLGEYTDRHGGRTRHPLGCGCCTGGRRTATATAPNGAKSFPGKRPWMISH